MFQEDFLEFDPSIAEEFGYEITNQISGMAGVLPLHHKDSSLR